VLVLHAHAEEMAIFPKLEAVAPPVAKAYERDHQQAAISSLQCLAQLQVGLQSL